MNSKKRVKPQWLVVSVISVLVGLAFLLALATWIVPAGQLRTAAPEQCPDKKRHDIFSYMTGNGEWTGGINAKAKAEGAAYNDAVNKLRALFNEVKEGYVEREDLWIDECDSGCKEERGGVSCRLIVEPREECDAPPATWSNGKWRATATCDADYECTRPCEPDPNPMPTPEPPTVSKCTYNSSTKLCSSGNINQHYKITPNINPFLSYTPEQVEDMVESGSSGGSECDSFFGSASDSDLTEDPCASPQKKISIMDVSNCTRDNGWTCDVDCELTFGCSAPQPTVEPEPPVDTNEPPTDTGGF